jgi:DNA-binding MarR family transcriptional regulator
VKKNTPSIFQDALPPQIGKTTKFISMLVKARFAEAGIDLTKEQFILLRFLELGPRPQSSLALITERDKGSLTRLVQSLERKNFIQRRVSTEDSRVNLVEMTPLGKEVSLKTIPVMRSIFELLQADLSPKELEITMQVMGKLCKNAAAELEKNMAHRLNNETEDQCPNEELGNNTNN